MTKKGQVAARAVGGVRVGGVRVGMAPGEEQEAAGASGAIPG